MSQPSQGKSLPKAQHPAPNILSRTLTDSLCNSRVHWLHHIGFSVLGRLKLGYLKHGRKSQPTRRRCWHKRGWETKGGPVGDRVRSTSWWVNSHGRRRRGGSPSESSVVVPRQDPEFPEKRSFHGIGMSQFIHMRFQGVQWFTAEERKRESTSSKLPSCMELCSQCPSPLYPSSPKKHRFDQVMPKSS